MQRCRTSSFFWFHVHVVCLPLSPRTANHTTKSLCVLSHRISEEIVTDRMGGSDVSGIFQVVHEADVGAFVCFASVSLGPGTHLTCRPRTTSSRTPAGHAFLGLLLPTCCRCKKTN
ncbi:hypothetical protein DENSPDRAFT_590840 [Dentipellis sp. KUC8613]|nr:hypothetical protein DENSPDRAFT_590840 [Dentipellis sp. KUC8613]